MNQDKEGLEKAVGELLDTLGILEMSGRKTIKISDVRYYLKELPLLIKEET